MTDEKNVRKNASDLGSTPSKGLAYFERPIKELAATNPEAVQVQLWLAQCYEDGHRVQKDEKEALRWYRLAADQGSATALRSLGNYYENGRGGVRQDRNEAEYWHRLADSNPAPVYHPGRDWKNSNSIKKQAVYSPSSDADNYFPPSVYGQHNLTLLSPKPKVADPDSNPVSNNTPSNNDSVSPTPPGNGAR